MRHQMAFDMFRASKHFAAVGKWTSPFLLSVVHQKMSTELARRREGPVAAFDSAPIWSFSSMRPHVLSQPTKFVELPAAAVEGTDEQRVVQVYSSVRADASLREKCFCTARMRATATYRSHRLNIYVFKKTSKQTMRTHIKTSIQIKCHSSL